jgi:hypothetical protein
MYSCWDSKNCSSLHWVCSFDQMGRGTIRVSTLFMILFFEFFPPETFKCTVVGSPWKTFWCRWCRTYAVDLFRGMLITMSYNLFTCLLTMFWHMLTVQALKRAEFFGISGVTYSLTQVCFSVYWPILSYDSILISPIFSPSLLVECV